MNFSERLSRLAHWTPSGDWQKITTIDAHTAGEPLRVIITGFPELAGSTILQRRQFAKERLDHLRTALMWEPRGHADMYGCLLTPPVSTDADFGVLFLHNEGYSTMCGHAIIAITKVVLQTGVFEMTEPETALKIDTPAGPVQSYARVSAGQVQSVRFHNVPSFALALDEAVEVPGLGRVRYDLAFGGAFYVFVGAADAGLQCTPAHFRELIQKGMAIRRAVMQSREIPHPFEEDLGFLYGTIFTGEAEKAGNHSRHVCIFAEGEVDRSPTGTGVSARLAILHARGEIDLHDSITIESILGTRFGGQVVQTTKFGPHAAVVPEVEGTAHITGVNTFVLDPDDPLRHGFILR